MPSLLDKVKNKLGLKKQPPGHKLGGGDYACQRQGMGSAPPKPKLRREMSDQEKEARRDAMATAAATREKQWDKKVSRGAQARRQEEKRKEQEQEQQGTFDIQSEQTLKTVEAAKRSEQELAQSMGYNPYEPVISTATKGGGAGSTSHATAKSSTPHSTDSFTDVEEDVHLQLNDALQCLLPQEDAIAFEKGKVCVDTVVKMLTNLATSPDEPKFRSIRLSNKHFSSKVAEVEGGLELILCAGFVLEEESQAGGEPETFLRHRGTTAQDAPSRQLDFTLARLRDTRSMYS